MSQVYHYCAMQRVDGGHRYVDGIVETTRSIQTWDDFKQLKTGIMEDHDMKCSIKDVVVTSISPLGVPV